jgi:chitodextrinase
VALLLVSALVAFFTGIQPGYAAGGTNLLTNGGFETGGGSLTGWTALSTKLSLASDGDGGGHAALATVAGKGKSNPKTYGLTTTSPPVTGAPAGERFTATGKVRSATPGKSACLVVSELAPGGSVVRTVPLCGTTTASWAPLPATTLTVATSGDSLSLTVQQPNGVGGDSFEADSLSLVNPDTTAPTVPAGLTATARSSTAVDLSWQASSDSDGAGVTGYVVSRNGTAVATLGAATSYRDTTVRPGTSYSYTVAAFDFARNTSASSAPAAVTTPADSPPSVPGNVSATAVSSSEVDVSWTASTDSDATGVAGYVVTRGGATLATLGPTATSYADTSVSPSTTYSYQVTAFDTAQNYSAPSGTASATTPRAPSTGVVDDVWHMNESSGTTMVDSGSTPHPGVIHTVVLGQPGDPAFTGTSYGFNGTSSYVDVGNSADLDAGDKDVHIALSLNTTTVPANPDYDLFRKGQYPGTEYKLELQTNGQFSCEFRTLQTDGTVKGYTIQPAIDLHDGKWHRLTCSKVGGTMTVTVDGAAFTKSITGSMSNTYHMIIGAYSASGGGDYYQGRIDEVSFRIG